MDIPNLSQPESQPKSNSPIALILVPLICFLAIGAGFGLSRLLPSTHSEDAIISGTSSKDSSTPLNADNLQKDEITVGKTYGDADNDTFKDTATGVIQKGPLNNEGTHVLIREGGDSQKAALTSSVLDLDLFVGHKVEIHGQTNSSKKVAWLLDVGTVKVLE